MMGTVNETLSLRLSPKTTLNSISSYIALLGEYIEKEMIDELISQIVLFMGKGLTGFASLSFVTHTLDIREVKVK